MRAALSPRRAGGTVAPSAGTVATAARARPRPGAEPELQAGEIYLADAQTLNPIWLDARTIKEFEESHLPGALFFDESDWDTGLLKLMNTWLMQPRPIVIYCGAEACDTSKRIAERLRKSLPEAEIYSLKGGDTAWQE